ncbi:hypothetical protein ACFFU1_05600 [Algibacter miyuki]|uniref:Uncharacterized protein n=1 Tax=Algibacter miyuki TaxID=1306933 RepID=A0ABV5GZ73_9FLAO|nr:hypothetical protein [Algibacter miyuki]MDN3665937.1 hypothetical protein [Algibacter miyuki]
MENGFVIIGIIAMLFISMYGYSYLSVAKEKARQKQENKDMLEAQELRRKARLEKQESMLERVRSFNKRKEEIRVELELLDKMKQKQIAS